MKSHRKILAILGGLSLITPMTSVASGWYIEPTVGISNLSDVTGQSNAVFGSSGSVSVETESGLATGVTLGYRYDNAWAAELGWEYRSNDAATVLASGQRFEEGDYASNLFFMNGVYHFDSASRVTPYIGAGLIWVQEIDIDVDNGLEERSWSSDGDLGAQVFAGLNYELSNAWSAQVEARISELSGLDLDAEDSDMNGKFTDFDYSATTLQFGLVYRF